MAKTRSQVRTEVLRRLGDTAGVVWSSAEIEGYLQEGYDDFCLETLCLWQRSFLEDSKPYTGTHVADWEIPWLDYEENKFNHTATWEDAYVVGESPFGPANHTSAWEWRNEYITAYIDGTVELPPDLLKVERITWDSQRLEPMYSSEMEMIDQRYKVVTGDEPIYWIWDQDGITKLRRYPIPTTTTATDVSGTWGIPRGLDADFTAETETGTWGIPRTTPADFQAEGTWGIPRYYPSQTGNSKIEYFRRGQELTSGSIEFEIPDHYVQYLRHYAMGKALFRESPGQDLKLAEHYLSRYSVGVQRVKGRISRLKSKRIRRLGGPSKPKQRIPTPRLPWNYGRVVRMR